MPSKFSTYGSLLTKYLLNETFDAFNLYLHELIFLLLFLNLAMALTLTFDHNLYLNKVWRIKIHLKEITFVVTIYSLLVLLS